MLAVVVLALLDSHISSYLLLLYQEVYELVMYADLISPCGCH